MRDGAVQRLMLATAHTPLNLLSWRARMIAAVLFAMGVLSDFAQASTTSLLMFFAVYADTSSLLTRYVSQIIASVRSSPVSNVAVPG